MNMLKRIINFLEYTKEDVDRLKAQIQLERLDNIQLKRENEALKLLARTNTKEFFPIVGFDDNNCEPTEPTQREEYIKNVDFFYDVILKDKLKSLIADIREMLSNIHVATGSNGQPLNMQRNEYDWYLRGMESLAWKLNEWATVLQGERRQSLQDKENQN